MLHSVGHCVYFSVIDKSSVVLLYHCVTICARLYVMSLSEYFLMSVSVFVLYVNSVFTDANANRCLFFLGGMRHQAGSACLLGVIYSDFLLYLAII